VIGVIEETLALPVMEMGYLSLPLILQLQILDILYQFIKIKTIYFFIIFLRYFIGCVLLDVNLIIMF
jgi:hypothetical protein